MGHLGWPESSLVQSHNYAPIKLTNTLRPHHSCEEYFFNRNSCRINWTNIIECYDPSIPHGLSVNYLCVYKLLGTLPLQTDFQKWVLPMGLYHLVLEIANVSSNWM